jgi:quercetin 2,3-dioxygenase
VVSHGPFIGDSEDDIRRLYSEYRQGKMPHLNDLPKHRKIRHTGIASGASQHSKKTSH